MRIQDYTIADLSQCLRRGHWFQCDPLPISRQRVLSQVHNRRAKETDVALLVAYDGDHVVGHLGIMPDRTPNQQRIGWLTAWWANPDRKYAGVGFLLLMRAFSLYGGRLGASGFSEDAKKVYEATKKFVLLREVEGTSNVARLNLYRLLSKRIPWIGGFRAVLKVIDSMVNLVFRARQSVWQKQQGLPNSCEIEYLSEIDPEAEEFIQAQSSKGLTRRGAKEINWIVRYPWILSAPCPQKSNFHFSAFVESHSVYCLKIRKGEGHLVGLLILVVTDNHVTVPYYFHCDQVSLMARVVCDFMLWLRAERLTVYQPELVEGISALQFPWLAKMAKRRAWIWSQDCAREASTEVSVQDGDGDCAFSV